MFFFSSRSRHTIGALVTGVHTCALPICEGMSAPVLNSRIAPGSDGFRANAAHNRALRDELHARVAQAGLGGPEKNRERHIARGKLLPRERVERLLDAGSPFLEIGQLAACDMYNGEVPGAGIKIGR